MKTVIRMSGLNIEVDSESDYIMKRCADYTVDTNDIDLNVKVPGEDIAKEMALNPGYSRDYYEFICLYRNICLILPKISRMLVHGALIDANGRGYLFAAKSGVGKTTHIRLWKKYFDDVSIINGDKPILRFEDTGIYGCGTPWCGKENYGKNAETALAAVCFIERGENNSIEKISPKQALDSLMGQILVPKEAESAVKTLELCSKLLELPCYKLTCNMDAEACRVARAALDRA